MLVIQLVDQVWAVSPVMTSIGSGGIQQFRGHSKLNSYL
jgi:hypothetical protein